MLKYLNIFYNKHSDGINRGQIIFSWIYIPVALPLLVFASEPFAQKYFDGGFITTILMAIYFVCMLKAADTRLRQLMLIMLPFGYFGEFVFSIILDMYSYREGGVPIYAAFAEVIVLATAHMISTRQWVIHHQEVLKKLFLVFFLGVFGFSIIVYSDIFTLIWGSAFFWFLRRKRGEILYYITGMLGLFGEISGTSFGAWHWSELSLGFIPSASLPVGVVFFYVAATVGAFKIHKYMIKFKILTPHKIEN